MYRYRTYKIRYRYQYLHLGSKSSFLHHFGNRQWYRKNPNLGHSPNLGQKLPIFLEPSTKRLKSQKKILIYIFELSKGYTS